MKARELLGAFLYEMEWVMTFLGFLFLVQQIKLPQIELPLFSQVVCAFVVTLAFHYLGNKFAEVDPDGEPDEEIHYGP